MVEFLATTENSTRPLDYKSQVVFLVMVLEGYRVYWKLETISTTRECHMAFPHFDNNMFMLLSFGLVPRNLKIGISLALAVKS